MMKQTYSLRSALLLASVAVLVRRARCTLGVLAVAAVTASTFGATTNVGTLGQLQTAINGAKPGDIVILSNGTYTASAPITITNIATATAPILIKAQSIGGVTIGGSSSFDFQAPAAWVTVQGFVFTNAGSQLQIEWGTSHCRLSRNVIQCTIPAGDKTGLWYAKLAGDDAQFDYNEVRNKNSVGQMLRIEGKVTNSAASNNPIAQRVWVHHNYFHDNIYQNGLNSVETVRWGLGAYSASSGYGLMEYNLFDRCDGDSAEMISNKSCNNTYRFNAFLNNFQNTFKLRESTNCLVYGNYFSNTLGLVIWGYSHQIFDNYFISNSSAIQIGNGDTNVLTFGDGSHVEPRFCVIAFNTLIGNAKQFWMDNSNTQYKYGAQSNTFANNIIVGSAAAASFGGTYSNGSWASNLIWNTTVGNTSPGDMPAGAYAKTNPLVTVPDAYGTLHLQSNSPAIGAAAAGYAVVTVDMDGQPRPDTGKDIGADQFSSAPVTAHFLTTNDVGPFAVQFVAPTITGIQRTGTANINLTFSGPEGQSYQVLASSSVNLPPTNWNILSSSSFGLSPATFTDTNALSATNASAFYRVSSP